MARRFVPVREPPRRRCLITGAASGIGRATAIAAAGRGAELYLTDIQGAKLEDVAGQIRGSGGAVAYTKAIDLSAHEEVVAMAEEIHAGHGSMGVVRNGAGISAWGTIEQLDHERWRRTIDVNLVAPISVLECFVPAMIEAGTGGHVGHGASGGRPLGLARP